MTYTNEYTNLSRILEDLKSVIQRENQRHEMDGHLTPSMKSLLEDEIIPMIENELDYDPTPQHLYDHSGGEPPITMNEIAAEAYRYAQLLKS